MPSSRSLLAAVVLPALLPATLAAQGGRFGGAVASADVNGDGFADVVVGEPLYDGSSEDEGRVLVYHGSASGPATTPSWTHAGLQEHARFGASLAGLGDVNADGYDDVAIGAPDFDAWPRRDKLGDPFAPILRDAGLLTVFLGSPSGLASVPQLFRPGILRDERIGTAVSAAGDVDGDGYDDVLVGATGTSGGRGIVLLFSGSPSGTARFPAWFKLGTVVGGGFGSALAGGGDVNGDGFDDVLLGEPGGLNGQGISYLYRGAPSGLPFFPTWQVAPEVGDDGSDNGISDWGAQVCLSDMNGDGRHDLVISNPTYDSDLGHGAGVWPDSGVVFVYQGQAVGPPTYERRLTTEGSTLAAVGDLDADGFGDVAYGTSTPSGWSLVSFGHPTYFVSRITFSPGQHCAGGDVDGDGFDELIAGDADHGVPAAGTGIVYVIRGSASGLGTNWTLEAP